MVEKILDRGLTLTLLDGTHPLKDIGIVSSLHDALSTGPFDLAVVAVKSFDTESLINSLVPYRDLLPPILSLQNGVENEMVISSLLGHEKVLYGTLTSAIGKPDPGKVVLEKLRGIGIANTNPFVSRIAKHFNDAGLNARIYSNPAALKWSKMLTNLLANASSAILDWSPLQIYSHLGMCNLEVRQIKEALAVMQTSNIPVIDLPGTSVRMLAWGISRLPLPLLQPLLKWKVGGGRGAKMPSFHIDLMSKRGKSEVDYLNGAVVRYGKKVGVKTPVNRLLNETLLALTEGTLQHADFQNNPQKLLSLIVE